MTLDGQDHEAVVLWAADCAEHVLPHFEERYPEDDRPRRAVEAGRAWARGEITPGAARAAAFAARAAARDAVEPAARAAARAAGHAAASAHVAGHAPHAAHYAASAATHAAVTTNATAREQAWQYGRLPEHLRPAVFPTPSATAEPGQRLSLYPR
ncbi:putative immunity protein [Streptoalloteichus hindustanus]|uniref:Imm-5-like domain-containing protein n=1 Tax=Streptoalloteichus hindustanus TaxID=2017 RepID=A0A1M4YT08_STRHI|nr:hypothetical protein [Streptoalloteichus hindustanus]SHF08954.1 hypothetical protein SAMN05444320_102473 [Streptoalloteichus hindustanus]